MKLQKLTLKNFMGATAEYDLGQLTIFAGPNESGKSRIADAIGFTLNSSKIRDVTRKKDYKLLLSDGAKSGNITVASDTVKATLDLPGGQSNILGDGSQVNNPFMACCVDIHAFSRIPITERRQFLLELTRTEITADSITSRLVDKGCDSAKAEIVAPVALAGFSQAEDMAKEEARQEKANWRAITGRTWSQNNGDDWQPDPVPEMDFDAEKFESMMEEADNRIEALIKRHAQAEAARRLKENPYFDPETQQRMRDDLERNKAKLADIVGVIQAGTDTLSAISKDLNNIQENKQIYECPQCGVSLMLDDEENRLLLDESASNATDAEKEETAKREAALKREYDEVTATLAEANEDKVELNEKIFKLHNRILEIENSTSNLKQVIGGDESDGDIANIAKRIEDAKRWRDKKMEEHREWERLEGQRARASEMADKAAVHHAAVTEWLKVADALSASGIQSDMVLDALTPVNARLQACSDSSGIARPQIHEDMSVTMGGRPYHLCSESVKWRADMMISIMVAELSGIGFVVIDRMDILDVPSRGQVMQWLMAESANVQMIVMGTLKAAPRHDAITSYWLGPVDRD